MTNDILFDHFYISYVVRYWINNMSIYQMVANTKLFNCDRKWNRFVVIWLDLLFYSLLQHIQRERYIEHTPSQRILFLTFCKQYCPYQAVKGFFGGRINNHGPRECQRGKQVFTIRYLSHSTIRVIAAFAADAFWEHNEKSRNCSWWAISPIVTMFTILFNNHTFIKR